MFTRHCSPVLTNVARLNLEQFHESHLVREGDYIMYSFSFRNTLEELYELSLLLSLINRNVGSTVSNSRIKRTEYRLTKRRIFKIAKLMTRGRVKRDCTWSVHWCTRPQVRMRCVVVAFFIRLTYHSPRILPHF